METIYYAVSTSDGYAYTFFFKRRDVMWFLMQVKEEEFANDGEGSFECENFKGNITDFAEVLEIVRPWNPNPAKCKHILDAATTYLNEDDYMKVKKVVDEEVKDYNKYSL